MEHNLITLGFFSEGRAEELFRRIQNEKEAMIDYLIETRQSEELFLDFKRSADEGKGNRLHDTDRNNLAKAISGFGNSEGGIIIWGVECKQKISDGDVARSKYPIKNVTRFVSWLEGAVSGCTLPSHTGVRSVSIETGVDREGYAVTYIPKSIHVPHQCILEKKYYYIRAGSSFEPVPHSVLAGMFGRRPQPIMGLDCLPIIEPSLQTRGMVRISLRPNLLNRGNVTARDAYLSVDIAIPGIDKTLSYTPMGNDFIVRNHNKKYFSIANDNFKMPPFSSNSPIRFDFMLSPPFESSLSMDLMYGCDSTFPKMKQLVATPEDLNMAYDQLMSKKIDGISFMKAIFKGLLESHE
jgi:hypothetical protein